jgi:plasmid stabilization system protein ParE
MAYLVRFTRGAEEDLLELYGFELYGFVAANDPDAAGRALEAIRKAVEMLALFPFSCRKADPGGANPLLREMIIPFGTAGYVALFEIEDPRVVTILAVRHQREDDFY